jgi:hypothetical protein
MKCKAILAVLVISIIDVVLFWRLDTANNIVKQDFSRAEPDSMDS